MQCYLLKAGPGRFCRAPKTCFPQAQITALCGWPNRQIPTNRQDVQLFDGTARAKITQEPGIFIRSMVGLDRETAKQAFSQFVVGTTATANQLEFIDLIVQYLTENGVMDPARLYESPFTDISQQGPEALFLPEKVTEMVRVLDEIRARAVA